jgi:nitrogenase molybdenum-iron protein alpha/beta subunit
MKTKNLLLIICILCSGVIYAQNSAMSKLFDKYESEDDITVISISKAMFKMIPGNISTGNVDIKDIIPKIESMRLINSQKPEIKEKMSLEMKALINNDKNYEELIRIKDGKSNITFNVRKKENTINELVMLIDSEKDFVAIYITGNFTFEDIQKIAEKTQ